MAKTRAQRKAERRAREARGDQQPERARREESRAQKRTQVPESPYEVEAEIAERGADTEALLTEAPPAEGDGRGRELAAPAPSRTESAPSRADVGVVEREEAEPADKITRRAQRAVDKERKARAKESEARRKAAPAPTAERHRGAVIGFFISCWAELKRVQWPDRDTLIQASAVTLVFIAIAAAYLGALDAVFSWMVNHLL